MKRLVIGLLVLVATSVWAQQPPPANSPEVMQLVGQLDKVGCQAMTITSAQTIAGLQKQISDLKAQNDELTKKLDPPKSGATKH